MNPYQTPGAFMGTSADESRPEAAHRLRRFVGNYYRALGWLGIATTVGSIATVFWTDGLHIDLSFVLWFWLGSSLKAGSPTARKWAIGIFAIVSAFAVLGFLVPDVKANFGDQKFDKSHPAFFGIVGAIWVIFAIPGIALLGRRGRAGFPKVREGGPAEAPSRSGVPTLNSSSSVRGSEG